MQRNARRAASVATLALVVALATAEAGESRRTVGDVVLCFSTAQDDIPVWGTTRMDVVVRNGGSRPALVTEPNIDMPGVPRLCEPSSGYPPPFHEVAPGTTWFFSRTLGIAGDASLSTMGDQVVRASMGVDLDGDRKADEAVVLEARYRVVEPPAEVLTIAQERGVEVELCKADGAGGARVKAIAIPWQDLENEQQARVRESIALPTPSMTPEEIEKRGGRLPRPSDPDDQKRLEEALKTDPAYLRWEALRGKMGLYAGYDYRAVSYGIHSLLVRRGRYSMDGFEAQWGSGLERRAKLAGLDCYAIQLVCRVFLDHGKGRALEYLDALAKEELRCADRAFLEEVRAIVLAAPDNLTRSDVVYQQKGE